MKKLKRALALGVALTLVAPAAAHAQSEGGGSSTSATSESTSSSKGKSEGKKKGKGKKVSCEQVFHIGDSISVGGKQAGLEEGYKEALGAEKVVVEATGGQAVIEKTKGVSGAEVIASHADEATDDTCWVIAFGTNDSNNISAGGGVKAEERIQKAVEATGGKGHIWWITPAVDAEKTTFADAAKDFSKAVEKAHKDGDLTGYINFEKYTDSEHWTGVGGDGIHLADYKEYVDFVTNSLAKQVKSQGKRSSSTSKSTSQKSSSQKSSSEKKSGEDLPDEPDS